MCQDIVCRYSMNFGTIASHGAIFKLLSCTKAILKNWYPHASLSWNFFLILSSLTSGTLFVTGETNLGILKSYSCLCNMLPRVLLNWFVFPYSFDLVCCVSQNKEVKVTCFSVIIPQ